MHIYGTVVFLIIPFISCIKLNELSCSDPLSSVVINPNADVFVGASLTLRLRSQIGCSSDIFVGSVKTLDAIEWALSILNQKSGHVFGVPVNNSFIPGVTIGLKIYDDCARPELAVMNAIKFLKVPNADSQTCNPQESLLLGMLGSTFSGVTVPLAAFMTSVQIPLISSQSFAGELSNKQQYSTFMRTSPSDENFQKAILSLIKHFNWLSFSIIHSDDSYGIGASTYAKQYAHDNNICILKSISIPTNPGDDFTSYDQVIEQIKPILPFSNVILLLASSMSSISSILNVAFRDKSFKSIQWVFTEAIGNREFLLYPFFKVTEGAFTFAPYFLQLSQLQTYLMNRRVENQYLSNPWSVHYYMQNLKCVFPQHKNYTNYKNFTLCKDVPKKKIMTLFEDSPFYGLGLTAIYTYAHSLKAAWEEKCGFMPGLCPELKQLEYKEFYSKYLKKAEFEFNRDNRSPPELYGKKVKFDENGNLENQTFAIYNYQEVNGEKKLIPVMLYHSNDNYLEVLASSCFHKSTKCRQQTSTTASAFCVNATDI